MNNMPYEPYATERYYQQVYQGTDIPLGETEKALRQASRHVDSLTYNRIVGRGFSNLTPFQQEIIQEVCCRQADFEHEYADEIESALQSYSLNGVSVSFGQNWNVHIQNGVAMRMDVYALLSQTGLCCRLLR